MWERFPFAFGHTPTPAISVSTRSDWEVKRHAQEEQITLCASYKLIDSMLNHPRNNRVPDSRRRTSQSFGTPHSRGENEAILRELCRLAAVLTSVLHPVHQSRPARSPLTVLWKLLRNRSERRCDVSLFSFEVQHILSMSEVRFSPQLDDRGHLICRRKVRDAIARELRPQTLEHALN